MQKRPYSLLKLDSWLVMSMLMAGCAITTPSIEQSLSTIQTPAHWQHATHSNSENMRAVDSKWWEAFGEPRLNQLVDLALQKKNFKMAPRLYLVFYFLFQINFIYV